MGESVEALSVKQIAEREEVSERQIQRYIAEGYKGCKLPAVRAGRSFQITVDDYKAWRVACGFEQAEPQPQVSEYRASPVRSEPLQAPAPAFNPWPLAADPNGPITNSPSEHSSNWPHPLAIEQHRADELRKQQIRLRGYPDE